MDLEIGGFGFASLVLFLFVLNLDFILVFDLKSLRRAREPRHAS